MKTILVSLLLSFGVSMSAQASLLDCKGVVESQFYKYLRANDYEAIALPWVVSGASLGHKDGSFIGMVVPKDQRVLQFKIEVDHSPLNTCQVTDINPIN